MNGLTTIEEARSVFKRMYDDCDLFDKIRMKCWINHSESRNRNNNPPFSYDNYVNHMRIFDYMQQIQLNVINVDDLGGKDTVFSLLFLKK